MTPFIYLLSSFFVFRYSCPQCRDQQLEMNCHRVYLSPVAVARSSTAADEALTRTLLAKNEEILKLNRDVARLKLQLKESNESEADDPGSRTAFHKAGVRVHKGIFNDSSGFNCESIGHASRECPNQCIIK